MASALGHLELGFEGKRSGPRPFNRPSELGYGAAQDQRKRGGAMRKVVCGFLILVMLSAASLTDAVAGPPATPGVCGQAASYPLADMSFDFAKVRVSLRSHWANIGRQALKAGCMPVLVCIPARAEDIAAAKQACSNAARALAAGVPSPWRGAFQSGIKQATAGAGLSAGYIHVHLISGVIDRSKIKPPKPPRLAASPSLATARK